MTSGTSFRNGKSASDRGIPKSGEPSAAQDSTKTIARDRPSQSTASGVHADRERQLAVFTDFWFAAVRYQILNGLSDNGLACDVLGVSDKTVGNWRDCIVAFDVIKDLIGLVDGLPEDMRSRNSQKVRGSLLARLEVLKKEPEEPPVMAAKKTFGLPSGKAFEDAVQRATHTVLASLVMDLDARASRLAGVGTPSPRSQSIAQYLSAELIDMYRAGEGLDLPAFRCELESRLAVVSQIASRLSLHKALRMFDLFHDEDAELAEALAIAVQEAKDEARSYVSKLYRRMEIDNQFSERASFRARLSSHELLYRPDAACDLADPFHPGNLAKAKDAELNQLWRLIDLHAETREP